MNVNGLFPDHNIAELKADPDTATVYVGKVLKDVTLQKVYDHQPGWEDDTKLEVEEGDHVLITTQHDGTGYINFMSWYTNAFHYRTMIDPDNPGTVEILKEL